MPAGASRWPATLSPCWRGDATHDSGRACWGSYCGRGSALPSVFSTCFGATIALERPSRIC
eukprot:13711331-Alexandrium_andersonii.AAC.1